MIILPAKGKLLRREVVAKGSCCEGKLLRREAVAKGSCCEKQVLRKTVIMKKKSTPTPTPIESTKHKDSRKNIPTEELRDFISDDENKPKTILYPRDPSLDPQLVWKGKDEQDQHDLSVPAVPIYIQEKIHPQAIIEDFRRCAAKGQAAGTSGAGLALRGEKIAAEQLNLFADLNGLDDFEKKLDFYHHDQHWSNRMILGDSLLVMTSLAEKEGLKGKVQTIYFDPPYGIKFGSNWQVSTRKRDVKDGKAEDATRQPEQIRAFRDTWKLGIHSYLSYLRDRLVVARELLTESGSVFVQINSENSRLVSLLLDEVFGSENFVADIVFRKKSLPLGAKLLETMHDHILFYAKDINLTKYRPIYEYMDDVTAHWRFAQFPDGQVMKIAPDDFKSKTHAEGTRYFRLFSLIAPSYSANTDFVYIFEGKQYSPPSNGSWVVSKEKLDSLAMTGRIQVEGKSLSYRLYHDDFPYRKITNLWPDVGVSYEKIYAVQTSPQVVSRCLLMTTDPGDLVLDPTCGSGTTAYVAEQWGRRWITTDTSRVAIALARTRLMTGRFPYYLLADSREGQARENELSARSLPFAAQFTHDIRKGFIYQRVPHVTLKSIANNPDIKEGMSRKQIDEAIARHAETETLYDKPYEDNKRLRVTGPFTVESLSPHRTISAEAKKEAATKPTEGGFTIKMLAGGSFTNTILENLKKAGVQNTMKSERLKFDSIEPYAGEWICGEGRFTDADDNQKRAAICIGPEHGTVGSLLVKEAAKEAVRGVGFDLLIVCGFAFDPLVNEENKRYGKLTVLSARMNPDLAMGDELLEKTGAGNLFMVFGEPDIIIHHIPPPTSQTLRPELALRGDKTAKNQTQILVEIKGLDVYDPTTGEIRSNSTDDIACWFIDTDYNSESFFVRHAYFTGADEPYEKLKKSLRAEIDESAWSELYSTKSRPFDKPSTGKIAVKVINHYGDEVLKVYPIK
jgi:adenine-specific DNA-methyltransferase